MQMIPTLEIDGHTLCESVAIMEYLDETRKEPPLLPADPAGRARVRELVLNVVASIQPLQNTDVLQRVGKALGEEERLKWGRDWIAKRFEVCWVVPWPC